MLVGVVGKPSSGKSTFFKALTLAEVAIGPYPFVTIKPNSGVGYVKVDCVDKEFHVQCNPRDGYCVEGFRFVPVQLIDVAGLVPGAHEGKGMGNQFLDDLRQADVLIHVVDCAGATNANGENVPPGTHDPAEDVRFLEHELDMWYLQIIKRGWERFARMVMQEHKQIDRALGKQLSGLKVTEEMVKDCINKLGLDKDHPSDWKDEDLQTLATELRRITKPMVIACNKIDVGVAGANFERLKTEFPNHMLIACSAEAELALKEAAKHQLIKYVPGSSDFEIRQPEKLTEKQKAALEFLRGVMQKFGSTGVQQVIDDAVFKLLGYIAIYPGGVGKLQDSNGNFIPDCFLMPPNTTALQFAYRLHTDFGDTFIKAVDVKSKMPVGKDHTLKHRDVVEIFSRK
jgi:ribosome-binding ATPase